MRFYIYASALKAITMSSSRASFPFLKHQNIANIKEIKCQLKIRVKTLAFPNMSNLPYQSLQFIEKISSTKLNMKSWLFIPIFRAGNDIHISVFSSILFLSHNWIWQRLLEAALDVVFCSGLAIGTCRCLWTKLTVTNRIITRLNKTSGTDGICPFCNNLIFFQFAT